MMLVDNYNILLIFLAVCFYLSFPKRGEVTPRDSELKNIIFSLLGTVIAVLLAQMVNSGQVFESFEFTSQIQGQLQHYFLYIIAIILFVILIINISEYSKQRWNDE